MRDDAPSPSGFRGTLHALFYGRQRSGRIFQSLLLTLDLVSVAYFIATSFVHDAVWIDAVDLGLGLLLAAEFLGRLLAHRHPMQYLDNLSALLDIVVIASLLTAFLVENLGFLRMLRTVRLLRSYRALVQLRRYPFIRRNEEIVAAVLNLLVFVIMISSLVYVTQFERNAKIENIVDALYFTVTSLTTTGYGDILLEGVDGRLLSIAIMIAGISLFIRLVQAAFRPGGKVRHPCPHCGLLRHDPDAVHMACGLLLNIPNDES